ncbi:protein GDAP2 homolog isoform X1 [Dermacentor albipictus]|uniref:protein GDAP2 homolog isoform X1 n=1 Tax=Dermacentor albipictus TaxID=60249 RepID=UPI0038FBEC24
MDPLGSPLDIVDVAVLKRWHQIAPREHVLEEKDRPDAQEKYCREFTPFPINEELNRKIALWVGDVTCLNAHAIVNSTNENLTDRSPLSQRLVARAGPQLKQDLLNEIQSCRTGEAKLSKGYNLPARFVIHTVGPKYNVKFHTAAETALHSSYWRVLQMIPEHGLRTLGLCPIHSMRRSYPATEGAHIALRTLRRFLERHGDTVDLIVVTVEGGEVGTYEQLLPLYFPRTSLEEEHARQRLPKDIGGPLGEPLLPERGIRIVDKPFGEEASEEKELDPGPLMEGSVCVGRTAFARMQGDVDRQGGRVLSDPMTREIQRSHRYTRLLRKARQEDLRMVREARFFYEAGRDRNGRPVFVFVGRRFRGLNPEHVLLQILFTLDTVAQPFVVVYLHTVAQEPAELEALLKDALELLGPKHRQNLHCLYLVHPGWWTRVTAWWFCTFRAPDLRHRLCLVSKLDELYQDIAPDQLDLPRFVLEHDFMINGPRRQEIAPDME